jgi:probable HAF family extracellular repeat protein
MKTSCFFNNRSFILAAALGIGPIFMSSAYADSYLVDLNSREITLLESKGNRDITATAINDEGRVVGDLGTAGGNRHAFITGLNGIGMTDLGTLGGIRSSASAINDSGQVVGSSVNAAGLTQAFITGPNGLGMRYLDLDTLRVVREALNK